MITETSDSSNPTSVPLLEVLNTLLVLESKRQERFYVVGGVVRDVLMGRSALDHDVDIVIEGSGLEVARELGALWQCTVVEHRKFLTAKVKGPFPKTKNGGDILIEEVDVATARIERYTTPGSLPEVSPASIEEDLWRRDFSVNAIALPVAEYRNFLSQGGAFDGFVSRVVDPTGGVSDIKTSTLRVLHPKSFVDDPTRLFRAVRYLVRLSFDFDMTTLAGFVEAVKGGCLATLTPRRVWNEVLVALSESRVTEVIQEFADRGLFHELPIVSYSDSTWLLEALERLERLRSIIGERSFLDAAKLLLLANLLRSKRDDIAHALHEGRRVLKRAEVVIKGEEGSLEFSGVSDTAAAYCIHCTKELRDRLRQSLYEVDHDATR